MSELFSRSKFNGDISQWNVSKVKNMGHLFYNSNPYWHEYKDQDIRNKAIDSYHLHSQLTQDFNQNNHSSKKIKI